MTQSEFDRWLHDYCAKFPSVAKWLNELPADFKDAQKRLWAECLAGTDFREAMRVTLRMAKGELERVGTFPSDMEETGVRIARAVLRGLDQQAKLERLDQPELFNEPPPRRRYEGSFLENWQRLKASGLTGAQVMDRLFGPCKYVDKFKCLVCRDTGLAEVWQPATVQLLLHGHNVREIRRYTGCVACQCPTGAWYIWNREGNEPRHNWWEESARYTPDRYCLLVNADSHSDEALANLVAWVEQLKVRIDARRRAQLEAQAPAQSSLGFDPEVGF